MVITDDGTVGPGSFDFTKSADHRNAEVVVMLDSPDVAARFTWN